MSNGEPGCHYFEQLCYNDMWLKVGDCVFIKSHGLVRPRVGRYVYFLLCFKNGGEKFVNEENYYVYFYRFQRTGKHEPTYSCAT